MLYLDSSALVKRYVDEPGSSAIAARFQSGERIFTSVLSYAEVLTALGRKHLEGGISLEDFEEKHEDLVYDCVFSLTTLELDVKTMSSLKSLVTRFKLKAGDAVQLSAALWLRDTARLGAGPAAHARTIEFGVADKDLAAVAVQCGLDVFNPESLQIP